MVFLESVVAEGNNSKGAPSSYVNKSTVAVTVLTVSMLTSQLAELETLMLNINVNKRDNVTLVEIQ